MNSSTSSFKSELKVFLVVAVVLALAEIGQRLYFRYGHAEAGLLHDFPVLADKLAAEKGTSMILLGNSLTQNGYDMALLKSQLVAGGHPDLHVEKVALSGSNPIEWYHNFDRNFVRRGKTPTFIVINMSPSGISDELPAGYRIGWLANETTWQDVPEVLFDDLKDVEIGGQYLQARVSMLYADRWDLRVGILADVIPQVPPAMKWVNSGQLAAKASAVVKSVPAKTYSLLHRLLGRARDSGTRVILVAMPARDRYTIDPALAGILQSYAVTFVDARNLDGLNGDCFEDDWHLNPRGANVFTTYMSGQLPASVLLAEQERH